MLRTFGNFRAAAVPLALWLAGPVAAAPKEGPPKGATAQDAPEWVIRACDILFARNLNSGGDSPLARSRSRLGWEWLAREHRLAPGGQLDRERFLGPKGLFDRLDRDGDGALGAEDFDWSEGSPFVRQQALAAALFGRLNQDGDGKVTAREWQEAFKKAAGKKDGLTPEDVRQLLYPARARPMSPPSRWHRLMGFFSGELGSFQEGPRPGEEAPDFTLKSPDGKTKASLSDYRGKRPVVLVFGNFT